MEPLPPLPSDLWARTPPEVQAYIEALVARVAGLEAARQELTEQVQQNAHNSSRPPSSNRPSRKRRPRRRQPSGRAPGEQPGHPGQTRELLPVEQVDEVISLKPTECATCQHELRGEDPRPHRHQVMEIPPIRPVVTEYQVHRWSCEVCGTLTVAEWPHGTPTGWIGPRAQALASICTGAYRLSKRTTQRLLDDFFNLSLSLGTISNLEAATTQALAAPGEQARAYIRKQSSAHLDESGWREGGQRAWLWVARELLGETFSGILVTDRWSAYNWYAVRWRQLCWAHLLRDFEAMIERGGAKEMGEALQSQAQQMFPW